MNNWFWYEKMKIKQFTTIEDFPENSMDLNIRAIFTTATGDVFKGYIVGVKNIFCIAIFWNGEILYFNKNLYIEFYFLS